MEQRYFIDSWLLTCSLRSYCTANPCQKMGFDRTPTEKIRKQKDKVLIQKIIVPLRFKKRSSL